GSPALRRWIIVALVIHGGLTEFLQQFVHRGASWRDVGLDSLGIGIGAILTWKRWFPVSSRGGNGRSGSRSGDGGGAVSGGPAGELPQNQVKHERGNEDENAPHLRKG